METKTKQKQIVVNVTADAKTTINSLKETLKVSDKEFVDAVLIVVKNTEQAVLEEAVKAVTIEKQKAKLASKLAKAEAKIAQIKAEASEEVVETAE